MHGMQIIDLGQAARSAEHPDPEPTGEEVLRRVEPTGPQTSLHLGDARSITWRLGVQAPENFR